MPFRRLADSNPTRLNALEAARKKLAASTGSAILIPPTLATQLDLGSATSIYSRFKKEVGDIAPALASQVAATTHLEETAHRLRLLTTQALHNIQAAIERGDLPAEVRGHYQLAPNQDTLPDIVTPADVVLWAHRIVTGDAARLASGSPAQVGPGPLAWPTTAQITTTITTLDTAETAQLQAKEKTDNEEDQAAALTSEVDFFIKDLWDTIEFNLRALDAPGLRRRAREWGVIYATRPGETPDPEPAPVPVPPVV